jgi:hypothetical protein
MSEQNHADQGNYSQEMAKAAMNLDQESMQISSIEELDLELRQIMSMYILRLEISVFRFDLIPFGKYYYRRTRGCRVSFSCMSYGWNYI